MATRRTMLASMLAATATGLAGTRPAASASEPLVYVGKDGFLFPSWEHEIGVPPADADQSLRQIAMARDVLNRNGIKLYISMVPSKSRVYRELLPNPPVVSPEFMGRYHHALDFFTRSGIPAANLLEPMIAEKPLNLQFMKTDTHWTSFGSAVAATETAKMYGMPASPPYPLPNGVPIPGGTSDLLIAGDLVPLLPAARQSAYKQDPLVVREFAPAGGVEATTFEVAVVGTSYCKPNLGFSQSFAYQIAKPVDLYWKLGSIGPWRLLVEYYDVVKKRGGPKPKAVVWQFSDYILGSGPESPGAWGKENAYASVDAWLAALRNASA